MKNLYTTLMFCVGAALAAYAVHYRIANDIPNAFLASVGSFCGMSTGVMIIASK